MEWGRNEGRKVYLKVFNSFDTDTAVMALRQWNRTHHETFIEEFKMMFKEAKELIYNQCMLEGQDYEEYEMEIPTMHVRLMNPKLVGQDTSQYSGWSMSKAFKRNAIHIEAETKYFDHIHEVVNVMKSAGLFKKYWGKNAHLSNIERD